VTFPGSGSLAVDIALSDHGVISFSVIVVITTSNAPSAVGDVALPQHVAVVTDINIA